MIDPDFARIRNVAAALAEHADSVVVIVTKDKDGRSVMTHSVKGNLYAAKESARQWLMISDERNREQIRHENDSE